MPALVFVYTTHALENLVDRDIARDWVERTITDPETTENDARHPERIRAYRAIPERGGRVLRVVYVHEGQTYRIITLFFDRGRRRNHADTI